MLPGDIASQQTNPPALHTLQTKSLHSANTSMTNTKTRATDCLKIYRKHEKRKIIHSTKKLSVFFSHRITANLATCF